MKIVTAAQMREIDRRATMEFAIPSLVLMENAGIKSADLVLQLLAGEIKTMRIVIIAGPGNNGGDGLVAARHLMNGGAWVDTFIMAQEEELSIDTRTNLLILQKTGGNITWLQGEGDLYALELALLKADLVVDAIYGIGFKGILQEHAANIVCLVNKLAKLVLALDLPSGVEADTGRVHGEAIRARHTITFALPKPGLLLEPGREFAGHLTVADISIPRLLCRDENIGLNLIDDELVQSFFKPRSPESHKGTYGHVLVIGGSPGMSGAVIMAAYGALRSGAGLVTAALPESLMPIIDHAGMELMTMPLEETSQTTIALEALPAIENLLDTVSVCVVGPGMSRFSEANALLRAILKRSGIPVLIDADGLNALEKDVGILASRQVPIVITPHPGEMARLTGKNIEEIQSQRLEIAREAAREWGVTVVLKGNKTLVAAPGGEVFLNIRGNPGMATAGSGDVLSGIIAGFIAQGMQVKHAAVVGVYLHALAGDEAAVSLGQRGLIAGDIINHLPGVIKKFEG